VLGGTLGWLVGVGALAIPGLGPFIAAGPIVGALAGVGAGSVVGGIVGALIGMGMPEYEAKRYEGQIRRGGILMSVHCDNPYWVKRAEDILKETGAEDIASAGEASADFAKSDKPFPRRAAHRVENREIKSNLSFRSPIVDEKLDEVADLTSESPLTEHKSGQK
jgi:hypothetical protein